MAILFPLLILNQFYLNFLIESLFIKEPNASQFRIDNENFSEDLLEEMISSQTLFAGKYVVLCDKLFEDKEISEIVLKELKNISKSENNMDPQNNFIFGFGNFF